jgi:acylphosphatase
MAIRQHFNIFVSGKVQGVFFRASAQKKAEQLGVTGFVRNQDGTVYLEAEGDEHALEEFVRWCKSGPQLAKVASVTATPGIMKYFREFSIIS